MIVRAVIEVEINDDEALASLIDLSNKENSGFSIIDIETDFEDTDDIIPEKKWNNVKDFFMRKGFY